MARTALNRDAVNVPLVYQPRTELWKDALCLSILTLFVDGVPGRSQKAALFLGLLLGFESLILLSNNPNLFTNCACWNVLL